MKKLATSGSLVILTSMLPYVAGAQTLQRILVMVSDIMGMLIPMALSAALIAFFWGLAKFIWQGSSNAEKRAEGMSIMVTGVAALFVMVSIWGLVALLQRTFGVSSVTRVPAPTICGQGGCGSFAPDLR
jgi:hypothetical protein